MPRAEKNQNSPRKEGLLPHARLSLRVARLVCPELDLREGGLAEHW